MSFSLEKGYFTERLAGSFLSKRGYKILDFNYRKKTGEIDIVAEKNGVIVFVEVKAEISGGIGFEPENRANKGKLRKVYNTAQIYLIQNKLGGREWQIDIMAVSIDKNRGMAKIKHFRNVDLDI